MNTIRRVPKYGQLKSIFLSTQPQINTSVYSTIKICLFAAPKTQKIRGPGFTSKSSEKPYISSIFTLSIMYFSQQNHALNTDREAKKNTDREYVVYQRKTYGNVPMWVIMKTLTFGQMSKMYSFLTTSMKTKISIHFEHVSEKELIQYMKVLTLYRNVCAHNERLFSYKSRFDIPDTILHKKMKLPQNGNKYEYGKNDLFSVVIAFRMLLAKDDFAEFKKSLNQIINHYLKKTSNLSQDLLLEAMGFPEKWKNISRYKL